MFHPLVARIQWELIAVKEIATSGMAYFLLTLTSVILHHV